MSTLEEMKQCAAVENGRMRTIIRGQLTGPYSPDLSRDIFSDQPGNPTGAGRKPTYDQDAIAALIEQGYSNREVANKIGCARSNVSRVRGLME